MPTKKFYVYILTNKWNTTAARRCANLTAEPKKSSHLMPFVP